MSTQPGVPIQKSKSKIPIQTLNNTVLEICNELKNGGQKKKEAQFSAIKAIKVHPTALIEKVKEFESLCDSEKLKSQVKAMITGINKLCYNGESKMFICQNSEKDGSKLEFICTLVYKYPYKGGEACGQCGPCTGNGCEKLLVCGSCRMCTACQTPIKCKGCTACKTGKECEEPIPCGECKACDRCENIRSCGRCNVCRKICEVPVACDYVLTTYSYKEKVNCTGLGIGISTIVGGIIIGTIALPVGIFTGGIGLTIAGAVAAGIAAGGGATTGGIIISKSANTNIGDHLKSILEACFVQELVEQKYAVIENGELVLPLEN